MCDLCIFHGRLNGSNINFYVTQGMYGRYTGVKVNIAMMQCKQMQVNGTVSLMDLAFHKSVLEIVPTVEFLFLFFHFFCLVGFMSCISCKFHFPM